MEVSSLSCRVVVIGDSNALKSKMIHTFMGDAPVAAHADIPKGSDCSRSTVKYVSGIMNFASMKQAVATSADAHQSE